MVKTRRNILGKVSLVGAGPGDPDLLTVKAQKLLRAADLIVYDFLVNPDHLRLAKEKARKICVGKRFRYQPISQAKINRLITQEAQKGHLVVRLKGGDPYLFGRGGEEALHLQEHHIPFEVIPGITSANACAAYAGIPLTHREHNASVTFLTGHRAGDKDLDSVPWKSIAALNGTVVIYMGFYNLSKIMQQLIQHGMSAKTPVAVIEWRTLPRQKSCQGTLSTIPANVKAKSLKAPCLIIVGRVTQLREKLNWFEKLPLFGKRIVVTRTSDRAGALREKLSQLGADVIEIPTIQIQKPSRWTALDRSIKNLANYNWLVFTSVYGVRFFFQRLEEKHHKDARALGHLKIACVGSETSKELKKRGLAADLLPSRYETAAIAETFKKRFQSLQGQSILLPRSAIAPAILTKALQKLGACVDCVDAYTVKQPKASKSRLLKTFKKSKVDFVTFTSASTVHHFVKLVSLQNTKKIAKKTKFASIGPITSRALKSHGLKAACQAKEFDVKGLVNALQNFKYLRRKSRS